MAPIIRHSLLKVVCGCYLLGTHARVPVISKAFNFPLAGKCKNFHPLFFSAWLHGRVLEILLAISVLMVSGNMALSGHCNVLTVVSHVTFPASPHPRARVPVYYRLLTFHFARKPKAHLSHLPCSAMVLGKGHMVISLPTHWGFGDLFTHKFVCVLWNYSYCRLLWYHITCASKEPSGSHPIFVISLRWSLNLP